MDIEVASPERQAELDGMTVEQLEARVSQEEGAAPPESSSNGAEATASSGGEAVGKPEVKPVADAEPAWFAKFKEEYKREQGSLRSLASMKDQLPALIEKQLSQRLQALQQAQNRANLSPEDQQAQAQLQSQQDELQKFVDARADARAKAQLDALAGDYLPLLNELKEQKADARLKESISELVSDVIPDMNEEKFNSLFEGLAEKIEAGDAAALNRFNRLTSDPSFAAIELIKLQRQQVQGQAKQVTEQRQKSAQAAAQGVKTGAVKAGGAKSVAEMSQGELDKLSIAELEAALPEN